MTSASKNKAAISSISKEEQERIDDLCNEIIGERAAQSSALSTQSRTIALGVLALAWLFLAGTQPNLSAKFSDSYHSLLLIAFLCIAALALDFLQYILALIETDQALEESKKATAFDEAGYDEDSALRAASTTFFWFKIGVTILAAGWMLFVILANLKD